MKIIENILRRYAARTAALVLLLLFYQMTRLPELSRAERAELAAHFNFKQAPLPELPPADGRPPRTVRNVHPSLAGISAWVSTVGAGVALGDLDEDGRANDLCYVDTRTDQVVVAPVPGTPERYQPFVLEPDPPTNPLTNAYDAETTAPMGCLPGDLNEDGLMDVLVYYWGRSPIAFLRRERAAGAARLGGGEYARREIPSGDSGRWYTNAAALADLDGDGHADLLIGNYYPDNARILDARAAGGREQVQHSMTRAFNGGLNRLLRWEAAKAGDEPTVEYVDVRGVLDEQTAHGWTLALGAADLDGDLLPEIYFANDFGPDRLLHNRSRPGHLRFARLEGTKTLTTPNSKVVGRDSFKGMGVDFADLNGDGRLDIYVSNIAGEYKLEESHFLFLSTGQVELMKKGVAPYVDHSEQLGLSRSDWSWDCRFGDFDNDGSYEALQATGFAEGEADRWPELHELAMANDQLLENPLNWPRFRPGDELSGQAHSMFFVRAKDGRYYDIAADVGFSSLRLARGIATADVDADGRLDLAVATQWNTSEFYHNEGAARGAFLGLRLGLPTDAKEMAAKTSVCGDAPDSGAPLRRARARPAVGATARVSIDGGRSFVAQVDGGNGHSGKRSPDLHFGLGHVPPGSKLTVELSWRDQTGRSRQEVLRLSPDRWYSVLLGQGEGGADGCR